MTTKTKVGKVRCIETCGISVGARPPVYRTTIVRDRHTRQLAEVALTEYPPIDPGDDGQFYVFKRDDVVSADHPAVIDAPGCFVPVED